MNRSLGDVGGDPPDRSASLTRTARNAREPTRHGPEDRAGECPQQVIGIQVNLEESLRTQVDVLGFTEVEAEAEAGTARGLLGKQAIVVRQGRRSGNKTTATE